MVVNLEFVRILKSLRPRKVICPHSAICSTITFKFLTPHKKVCRKTCYRQNLKSFTLIEQYVVSRHGGWEIRKYYLLMNNAELILIIAVGIELRLNKFTFFWYEEWEQMWSGTFHHYCDISLRYCLTNTDLFTVCCEIYLI